MRTRERQAPAGWSSPRAGSGPRRRSSSRTSTRWSGGSRRRSSPTSTRSPSGWPGTRLTCPGTTCVPRISPPSSGWASCTGSPCWPTSTPPGPAVFARATIHAFEQHEEDPVRKCFFSITRDEMNHEECCQRTIAALWPGGPLDWAAAHRPGEGRAQQHQLAVPQRRPLLERLQQGGRQVLAGRPVHQLHDGRDGGVHAVPRDGVGRHAPGVRRHVPAGSAGTSRGTCRSA